MKTIQISCKCCGEKIKLSEEALEQMLEAIQRQERDEQAPVSNKDTMDMFNKLFGMK